MHAIAERGVVKICTPVSRQVVEAVPDWRRTGCAEIDIGIEDGFVICAGRFTDGSSVGPGDQRTTQKTASPLATDSVGGGDIDIVDVCCRHGEV